VATIKKYNNSGSVVGELAIEEQLVQTDANPQMIKDYIVAIRNNARQWSASTKTRPEVSHSGQKPHPQKGTGRARQGYLGAAQYKGGGRVHAPRPKFDQHVRINKKERRAANRHLLAQKILAGNVHVLCYEKMKAPKTQSIAAFLEALKISGRRVLFLYEAEEVSKKTSGKYQPLVLSIRNLPRVEAMQMQKINGYALAIASEVIVLDDAVGEMVTLLGGKK
jgi:large subunit ribosomal protein L4